MRIRVSWRGRCGSMAVRPPNSSCAISRSPSGTVLQDPAKQIVGATVEAELAFGPENLGVPREEIRDLIRLVAEQAGIEPLLGRETAALSGGERQLLAVAGILMMRPRLYVVDEPLANLDPAQRRPPARDPADACGCAEMPSIIVEHRVEEALQLRPDRVLYLDDGRTRYLGPVEGFLRDRRPACGQGAVRDRACSRASRACRPTLAGSPCRPDAIASARRPLSRRTSRRGSRFEARGCLDRRTRDPPRRSTRAWVAARSSRSSGPTARARRPLSGRRCSCCR